MSSKQQPSILALGLNPVLQKTLVFEKLTLGQVNRARDMIQIPGGKGFHFARAANTAAKASTTIAHFLGGANGEEVGRLVAAYDIPQLTVGIAGETRVCTTLLDEDQEVMTELIDPSPQIAAAEVEEMRQLLLAALATADGVGLCGTFPPGVGSDFYAWAAANKGDAKILLDGYRDVAEALDSGGIDILKLNLDAARELTSENDVRQVAAAGLARWRLGCLALTDGGRAAYLFTGEGAWEYHLPDLPQVRNPLGAGDTAGGVMLLNVVQGVPEVDAFALGLAAASASCLNLEGGQFTLAEMRDLHAAIDVRPLA